MSVFQVSVPREKMLPHSPSRSGSNRSQFRSGRRKRQCSYAYVYYRHGKVG
jgi:plasmid stabilization system protein ParE